MSAAITCPKCGGECWDNRGNKRSPTGPDARCKDRNCDGRIWKVKAAPARITPQDAPSVLQPRAALKQGRESAPEAQAKLSACYRDTTAWVMRTIAPMYADAGTPLDASTTAAIVATLYISRCGRGR